jgi:hypothetical protein
MAGLRGHREVKTKRLLFSPVSSVGATLPALPSTPSLRGENSFIHEFTRLYGPGTERYPGPAALVAVTRQSREAATDPDDWTLGQGGDTAPSPAKAGTGGRTLLGTDPGGPDFGLNGFHTASFRNFSRLFLYPVSPQTRAVYMLRNNIKFDTLACRVLTG